MLGFAVYTALGNSFLWGGVAIMWNIIYWGLDLGRLAGDEGGHEGYFETYHIRMVNQSVYGFQQCGDRFLGVLIVQIIIHWALCSGPKRILLKRS